MKTSFLSILLLTLSLSQSCNSRPKNSAYLNQTKEVEDVEIATCQDLYYEKKAADADIDWEEEISVFHYWRDISNDEYYFGIPSEQQVITWKAL